MARDKANLTSGLQNIHAQSIFLQAFQFQGSYFRGVETSQQESFFGSFWLTGYRFLDYAEELTQSYHVTSIL